MRKLPALFIAGAAAVALAGTAIAAHSKTHVMTVPLGDGSVARIEYAGDVAPKVTVAPPQLARVADPWSGAGLPAFAGFDRIFEEMNRQSQAMMRQQQMARQPGAVAGTPYVASYGAPAGATSYSVSTVSNGSCTRTTEVVSQGDGKPPRVTTNVSGNCGQSDGAPTAPSPAGQSGAIDRT